MNGISYNSSTNRAVVITGTSLNTTAPNGLGREPIGFFASGDTITFGFVTPINAFGIDLNTFAVADGSYEVVTNLGDIVPSSFDPFPRHATGQFVGIFSDTPINAITINNLGGFPFNLDTLRFFRVEQPTLLQEPCCPSQSAPQEVEIRRVLPGAADDFCDLLDRLHIVLAATVAEGDV